MPLELVTVEGFQDLKPQEKTALRDLAKHIDEPGYLIPSLLVAKYISNREVDAVIVLPDMLVLLELKDYWGRVIRIDGLNTRMVRIRDDGSAEKINNPCRNLAYSAKVLTELFRKARLPSIPIHGMLIFTNKQLDKLVVENQLIGTTDLKMARLQPKGQKEQQEYGLLGGVAVCRLPAIPSALLAIRQEHVKPPVKLNTAERAQLKNVILGEMSPLPREVRLRIGSYVVDQELDNPEEDYRLKLGHETVTDLPVWIKEYRRDILSLDPDADTELLLRGAVALSNLGQHDNLPVYVAHDEASDCVYIILKREPGSFLRELMESGNLSWRDKLHILRDLLAGLQHIHCHQEGTRIALYRDLRPESVFVTQAGRAHLFNFDCTRLPSRITALKQARGRAQRWQAYASFELLNAQRPEQVDTPTDIYSWGVVAYELLTGRLPFADARKAALKQFIPLANFELPLPQLLQDLIDQALSQGPSKRPPIARLQAAVQEAIDGLS